MKKKEKINCHGEYIKKPGLASTWVKDHMGSLSTGCSTNHAAP